MKRTASKRSLRMADLIMREIAIVLVEEIQDPRLDMVSITGVKLNSDLRLAEVSYTLHGGPERRDEAQKGLEAASGFLRSRLKRLKLKFLPELRFKFDDYLEDMVYGKSDRQD